MEQMHTIKEERMKTLGDFKEEKKGEEETTRSNINYLRIFKKSEAQDKTQENWAKKALMAEAAKAERIRNEQMVA